MTCKRCAAMSSTGQDSADWGVTTLKIYAGTARPVGRKVIEEGHRLGLGLRETLRWCRETNALSG